MATQGGVMATQSGSTSGGMRWRMGWSFGVRHDCFPVGWGGRSVEANNDLWLDHVTLNGCMVNEGHLYELIFYGEWIHILVDRSFSGYQFHLDELPVINDWQSCISWWKLDKSRCSDSVGGVQHVGLDCVDHRMEGLIDSSWWVTHGQGNELAVKRGIISVWHGKKMQALRMLAEEDSHRLATCAYTGTAVENVLFKLTSSVCEWFPWEVISVYMQVPKLLCGPYSVKIRASQPIKPPTYGLHCPRGHRFKSGLM